MKVKLKELKKLIRERLNKLTENQPEPATTPRPGKLKLYPEDLPKKNVNIHSRYQDLDSFQHLKLKMKVKKD